MMMKIMQDHKLANLHQILLNFLKKKILKL